MYRPRIAGDVVAKLASHVDGIVAATAEGVAMEIVGALNQSFLTGNLGEAEGYMGREYRRGTAEAYLGGVTNPGQ